MQKKLLKRITIGILVLLFMVQTVFCNTGNITAQAATKDKTKPTVILYQNKTNYTRGTVYLKVSATDKSGIKSILIKKGNIKKTASKYWKKAENITKNKKLKVSGRGTWSVKVTDKKGNITVKQITVTNIDKDVPYVSLWQENVDGGVQVSVAASDYSGIKSIKWIKGNISDANSSKFSKAKNITSAKNFFVNSNGTYSVQVVDGAGNKSVQQIAVTVKKPLYDLDEYYGNRDIYKYARITDSLGKSYLNAIRVSVNCQAKGYTYQLDGEYQYIEGDIACCSSKTNDGILQIYADDELVFTSDYISAKNDAIHFKVDVQNAKFIMLKINNNDLSWDNYILGNCYLYN